MSRYIKSKEKVLMKHLKCGHEYLAVADSVISNRGCPKCRESKGEKIVSKILNNMELSYKPQFTFEDCRHINKLSFDFALISENGVYALIEYQGIQHYKPVAHFGGLASYNNQIIRDNIKRKYCLQNKLPLIEIPYHITNIENFLVSKITKLIPR